MTIVAGRVDHRLVALRARIDDRQAAVGETNRPVGVLALAVGAAVGDRVAHATQQPEWDRRSGAVERTSDPAQFQPSKARTP